MPDNSSEIKAEPRRWFRFYAESVNDPKVQRLPAHLFKTWVNLLCLASANGGTLPSRDDIAFQLRMSDHDANSQIDELIGLGLIDIATGKSLEPHNWKARQYISDTCTARVAKHRAKRVERGLTKSVWINKKTREEVFARDGSACVYCASTEDLTLDHKVPEIRGGNHDSSNLQVACRSCNASKRDMTHDEFSTWNGRVTLQVTGVKRPQITEQKTEHISESEKTRDVRADDAPKRLRSQGSRLSNDFELPEDWRQWAKVNCLASDDQIDTEAANFADYWIAKPSQATSLDWKRTWQKWARKSFSPAGNRRPQSTGTYGTSPEKHQVEGISAMIARLKSEGAIQ